MNAIIDAAFERTRTVVLAFVMIVIMGAVAYTTIPKEADPDIQIPIIYVSLTYEGISPEDSERLLVRPMEKELQSIEGIKEMRSMAGEGYGSITLEFYAGFDSNKALEDVREKVDIARAELPLETDEPRVNEVNIAHMHAGLFKQGRSGIHRAVEQVVGVGTDHAVRQDAGPGLQPAGFGLVGSHPQYRS